LKSQRVSSASKIPDCVVAHRSNRSGIVVAPSSVLQSWLCGSTKEPSGFLVNHRKPRELGVASANLHSWLGSHVVPARPWFWGATKKPSTTSSCCSCHHTARTWPCWPPGPSNEAYLSSPHLEASPATTFHAGSSPAPTRVKSKPAPAILSQESVHTTLSITHHTRKRPSTDPRTTHGPHLGLAIPQYTYDPTNLVGRPGCVTPRGRFAHVALPVCSGHPGFYVGNEGLPVGCAPNGPTKYFCVLGRFMLWHLPEVGMPRVTLPESLQQCRISGCLCTPYD
jgi:hypothetical protein